VGDWAGGNPAAMVFLPLRGRLWPAITTPGAAWHRDTRVRFIPKTLYSRDEAAAVAYGE
jgi:hypothetical protein